MYLFLRLPLRLGKAARAVGGIAKKGAKFVGKVYRNMGR